MKDKYLVLQVQQLIDGTVANIVFCYDSLEQAKQSYHYFLSANIGNPALKYCMCSIVDHLGLSVLHEVWGDIYGGDDHGNVE